MTLSFCNPDLYDIDLIWQYVQKYFQLDTDEYSM